MKNIAIVLFCFAILSNSCASGVRDTTTISSCSDIKEYLKTDFEGLKAFKQNDTLFIVSTNDFLYHPFGRFSNADEFCKKYKWTSQAVPQSETKSNMALKKVSKNKSSMLLVRDSVNMLMEIVGGTINGNDITTINGIEIGMNYNDLISIFFQTIPACIKTNIKVIQLESGLTGIWHFYKIDKNKLVTITFRSDYVF